MNQQSFNKVEIIYQAIDEKLGRDIEVIDIEDISIISDFIIIASANNINQIQAIVDLVEEEMAEAGFYKKRLEGNKQSTWVLVDYEDVVVHIFSKDDRMFYDLDRIWKDGKKINM